MLDILGVFSEEVLCMFDEDCEPSKGGEFEK